MTPDARPVRVFTGPHLVAMAMRAAPWVCLILLWHLARQYAWITEDAFINFRVIDHLLAGLGPDWNVGERVQVYTSVLWMAGSALLTWLVGSPIEAAWLLSLALVAATVLGLWRLSGRYVVLGVLMTVAWASSHSVRDYLCSGLETPLVMAAVVWALIRLEPTPTPADPAARVRQVGGAMALCALVRHDLLVLLWPLAAQAAWPAWRQLGWQKAWRQGMAGAWPLLAWSAWSWLYHGSPVPNTARAKVAEGWDSLAQAGHYFAYMQGFDPLAYALMLAAVAAAWASRSRLMWPLCLGLLSFALYLMHIGGDYMAGRFFIGPVTFSVAVLARVLHQAWHEGLFPWPSTASSPRWQAGALAFTLGGFAATTWLADPPSPLVPIPNALAHGIADERLYYWSATDLSTLRTLGVTPRLRANAQAIGQAMQADAHAGPFLTCTIGMTGYFAPSQAIIIDPLALSDRFLAGLPPRSDNFRVGHVERAVPADYLASRVSGQNRFRDPVLAAYYDDVQQVVSGPLWSMARLGAIWRLSSGSYTERLAAWGPQDGGGAMVLPSATPRERQLGCLGSWQRVMRARQNQGQITLDAIGSPR